MLYMITLRSDWRSVQQRLQIRFTNLSDKDFEGGDGNEQITLEHLQVKLGKSRQELIRLINKM
ncbi:MAG TPA: hypothetical protein VGD65_09320 [Chryseosolibacter sp.]